MMDGDSVDLQIYAWLSSQQYRNNYILVDGSVGNGG